jgi:S1-C subfamily serine protease
VRRATARAAGSRAGVRRAAVALVALAAAVTKALAVSDRSAPGGSPAVTAVRVTAGTQIATGFVVGHNRIVTVAHVLDRPPAVNGRRGRVVRVDRRSDLALLALPGPASASGSRPAIAAESPSPGIHVLVLRLRSGRLSSLSGRVRRAIVAHVRVGGARPVARPALELEARVLPGDSGAPVLSDSGALAGVVFAASSRRENTAYAVDGSAVARLLAAR